MPDEKLRRHRWRPFDDWLWKLTRNRAPLLEAYLLIARTKRESGTHTGGIVPENGAFAVPSYRSDGLGIQAMHRIGVMHYAESIGCRYLHLPFLEVAHRASDGLGKGMTEEEWASRWEALLNLGSGEMTLMELATHNGHLRTALRWVRHRDSIAKIRTSRPSVRETFDIFPVAFEFLRNTERYDYSLSTALVTKVRQRFVQGPALARNPGYEEGFINVAIHIRRGDVWRVSEGISTEADEGHRIRFVGEGYYVDLIRRIYKALVSYGSPVKFHIFTDGRVNDFKRFEFVDDTTARLTLDDQRTIENIIFHAGEDAFETLFQLSKAPILIPAKSAFSALAIVLGNSTVIYDDFVFELGVFAPLRRYMKKESRFFQVGALEKTISSWVGAHRQFGCERNR